MDPDDEKTFDIVLDAMDPYSFEDRLRRASADPMSVALECQTALSSLEETFEKPLNQLLSVGYAVAFRMRESPEELRRLITNNCWSKTISKPPEGVAILRLVFRLLNKAWARGPKYDTACRWTTGLSRAFQSGVRPEDILPVIKRGEGIEKLYEAETSRRRSEKLVRAQPYRSGSGKRPSQADDFLEILKKYEHVMSEEERTATAAFWNLARNYADVIRRNHEEDGDS